MSRTLLLDTTVFSAVLRKSPEVQSKLIEELGAGAVVLVSPVVYYELRRGLLKRDARRLLEYLDRLIATLVWTELTRGDWEEAAQLWVRVHRAGQPRADADLLISAQANRRDAVVVTDNLKHFRGVAEAVESWSGTA